MFGFKPAQLAVVLSEKEKTPLGESFSCTTIKNSSRRGGEKLAKSKYQFEKRQKELKRKKKKDQKRLRKLDKKTIKPEEDTARSGEHRAENT